jgi:hypothetical protein
VAIVDDLAQQGGIRSRGIRWSERRQILAVVAIGLGELGRDASGFDPIHQRPGNGIAVVTDVIFNLRPCFAHVFGPDRSPVL